MCAICLWLLDWDAINTGAAMSQALACFVSGVVTSVIALLLIPVFETLFKITTDITLLELSDMGHPLLHRLAIEAPGTYHHSLVVANLSQSASDGIGANGLRARVCSYYHDIGKLTKPDFFTENMQLQDNPHDDLTPNMSTLIITSHVKEGVSLALLHKLPQPVQDVIMEHHGTGVVIYFHHKARRQIELDLEQGNGSHDVPTKIEEGDFRYPGPKPQTRESAIISLADGVESASRSLSKATPAAIESLVEEIVSDRVSDGQLDDCELTFTELAKIKKSFIFTLAGMHHARIAYPKDENSSPKSTEPLVAPDRQAENSRKTLPVPGETTRA